MPPGAARPQRPEVRGPGAGLSPSPLLLTPGGLRGLWGHQSAWILDFAVGHWVGRGWRMEPAWGLVQACPFQVTTWPSMQTASTSRPRLRNISFVWVLGLGLLVGSRAAGPAALWPLRWCLRQAVGPGVSFPSYPGGGPSLGLPVGPGFLGPQACRWTSAGSRSTGGPGQGLLSRPESVGTARGEALGRHGGRREWLPMAP